MSCTLTFHLCADFLVQMHKQRQALAQTERLEILSTTVDTYLEHAVESPKAQGCHLVAPGVHVQAITLFLLCVTQVRPSSLAASGPCIVTFHFWAIVDTA